MKILVVSTPRCRTTFLCQSIEQFYKIPNFHESFDYISERYNIDYVRYGLMKKKPTLEEVKHQSKEYIQKTTSEILNNNGVAKLFPRYLLSYFFLEKNQYCSIDDLSNFSYLYHTDVSEMFNLSMYHKIIFLERDLIETAISYAYGQQTKQMLFTDKNLLNYVKRKDQKIEINYETFKMVNFLIFEFCIFNQLKKFIIKNYKNYENLTYDNCIDHVSNNYGAGENVKVIETNFDYSNLILNYDELRSYIVDTLQKYSVQVPNFYFK